MPYHRCNIKGPPGQDCQRASHAPVHLAITFRQSQRNLLHTVTLSVVERQRNSQASSHALPCAEQSDSQLATNWDRLVLVRVTRE